MDARKAQGRPSALALAYSQRKSVRPQTVLPGPVYDVVALGLFVVLGIAAFV